MPVLSPSDLTSRERELVAEGMRLVQALRPWFLDSESLAEQDDSDDLAYGLDLAEKLGLVRAVAGDRPDSMWGAGVWAWVLPGIFSANVAAGLIVDDPDLGAYFKPEAVLPDRFLRRA